MQWADDEPRFQEFFQGATDPLERKRFQALWLLRQGKSVRVTATEVGVHPKSVRRWMVWYSSGGIEALKRRPHRMGAVVGGKKSQDEALILALDQPLGQEIVRVGLIQIDQVLKGLKASGQKHDKAIHDARKSCKRIRAILRLVRDEIGRDVYQHENIIYRDVARQLSSVRSSAVTFETLDALVTAFPQELQGPALAALRQQLVARHNQLIATFASQEGTLQQCTRQIMAARERFMLLPLNTDDFGYLQLGLTRVYGQGRSGMNLANRRPTKEHFHEWRKQVKYLRYQMYMISAMWPAPIFAYAHELVRLTDLLGLDHDMAELADLFDSSHGMSLDYPDASRLIQLIAIHRRHIQSEALSLGRRVYFETPTRFGKRHAGYWRAACG